MAVYKGYRGINRDVTKKKIDENKLRWNEAFLRTMADNSPLAFYVVDERDGRILYYNKLFIEIWGLSQIETRIATRDMKDSEVIEYILPMVENGDRFMELGHKFLNSLNREILDDEIRLKDGRVIGCKSTQILDENDIYHGRLYIFEDITDRKRAENALWENQRFLSTLIGNLPGMVYRCYNDDDWTMDYVSEGGYELTGYHIEDLVTNRKVAYNNMIHKDDRERVRAEIETALRNGQPIHDRIPNRRLRYGYNEPKSLSEGKDRLAGFIPGAGPEPGHRGQRKRADHLYEQVR